MKRVLLLLCKGVEVYEAAAFYDVLGWSGSDGLEAVGVTTVGLDEEITCTFGLRLKPDALLSEIEPSKYDALAVPGGFEDHGFYDHAFSAPVSGLIRRFHELGKPIASICVGALPLAKSGILKGRKATTYHLMEGHRRKQLAALGADVQDEPLVVDGEIASSTSPATAMDVAFWLLEKVTTPENARLVRHRMGFQ